MDISMPGMDGLVATRRIKGLTPHVRIVMLTVSEEERSLFEAIRSGAQGYLLKKMKPHWMW
jgi:DNA-binding NarL/FixJ family response regulator